MAFRKIEAGLVHGSVDNFIGKRGTLFYDVSDGALRISDGTTPGGSLISSGGSGYTLPTATSTTKGGVKIGSNITITDGVISVAAPFSGSYNDLTNKPTIPSLDGYATETYVTTRGYITSSALTGYATLTGEETLTNKTLTSPTIDNPTFNGTFAFESNNTDQPAMTLTASSLQDGVGILRVIGSEPDINFNQVSEVAGFNTFTFEWNGDAKLAMGRRNDHSFYITRNFEGWQDNTFVLDYTTGVLSVPAGVSTGQINFADETVQSTAWTGSVDWADVNNQPTIYSSAYIGTTSLDFTRSSASQTLNGVSIDGSILWINSTPAPGDPFRTTITANSGNASISLSTGLPNLGSTVSWTFDTTKITFPDSTTQTTAYTATAAKGLFSVTTNSASGNGSLSYSNGVFTFTPASVPTTVTINGTAVTLGSSGTVTAAAGTLTGNTLASGVTASSLTSVGTLTSLTSSGLVRFNSAGVGGSYNAAGNSVNIGGVLGVASNIYANGNIDIVAGSAYYIGGTAVLNGTTLGSNIVNSSLTSVGTLTSLTSTGSVTANHTTAFIAGDNAISGVALQMPREGALRNTHNGANNNMYFDVSTGGTSNGQFQFRSSSAFTNVLTMSPTAFNVNSDAVVTSRTPSFGRLPFNSAIDTELTIDDMRFRISNQGGIFPQVIGNGSSRNLAWTVVAARSGSAVTQTGSTGTIVASNAWTSLYTSGGMDSAGDTYVATIQDKGLSRIYRVTFMRSDNGSTTGYNIIAERLL